MVNLKKKSELLEVFFRNILELITRQTQVMFKACSPLYFACCKFALTHSYTYCLLKETARSEKILKTLFKGLFGSP